MDSAMEQFSFVIAYDDLSAARRGIRVIADLTRHGTEGAMWRPLYQGQARNSMTRR